MRTRFTPSLFLIGILGFYSGLPLALTASTLTAWLADAKIERAAIGLFAAVGMPYALKFLWAPMMDGLQIPILKRLGRRRSWLLLTQLLLTIAILAMGSFNPATSVGATAIAALLVATFSATQDIVIDAYRVERLTPEEQGLGAAYATFGYRIGMLISGAGALALADLFGWQLTYWAMAALVALSMVLTLFAKEPEVVGQTPPKNMSEFIAHAVVAPLRDFMTRPNWLALLLFVIIYKLGDALIGAMFNPFLLDLGFTKMQIAEIVKLYGVAAALAGTFLGGWLVVRIGAVRTILLGGILHSAANLLLIPLCASGANAMFLAICIALINITGGIGLAAFIAYLAALCKRTYTATQYALLSALSAVGRTFLSTPSGWLATTFGWPIFFMICCALTLPGLALLWWIERRQRRLH